MIELARAHDCFSVKRDGACVGSVRVFENNFHHKHAHISLDLNEYNAQIGLELFPKLRNELKASLQTLIHSSECRVADFLLASGFARKRRCYEIEATRQAYLGPWSDRELPIAYRGEAEYDACCKMLYGYYQRTHAAINPLTATLEQFCRILPDRAYYQGNEGQLKHLAFIDENEIAYIATTENASFGEFAAAIVCRILSAYHSVNVESDDCDDAAMTLRSLFLHDDLSNDTYIYEI